MIPPTQYGPPLTGEELLQKTILQARGRIHIAARNDGGAAAERRPRLSGHLSCDHHARGEDEDDEREQRPEP